MKCHKSKFAAFAEKQGWLELYDTLNDKGSEMGYLLQDGASITAYFDESANFRCLTDRMDITMLSEDEDES